MSKIDPANATLAEHLKELRRRIMFGFGTVMVAFGLAYAFKEQLFRLLTAPLFNADSNYHGQMVFTSVPEFFFSYVKLAFLVGLFAGLPVLLVQLWRFMAPGLYQHEKRLLLPFLIATPVLFYAGGLFAYWVVMPIAIKFFFAFATPEVIPLPSVREYLSFFLKMLFGFGLAFEMPVALLLAVRAGLLSPAQLAYFRRYAWVLIFIAAAVLTPPDPLSQMLLAVPMLILYEVAVWGAYFMAPQKNAPEAE